MKKQVETSHYRFGRYFHKRRWASLWHQLDEVLRFDPEHVLEAGPGPGMFKSICRTFGLRVETVDIDPDLRPDHVCSVLALPFENRTFDVTCAFQMLEHIPFDQSMRALAELGRVAKKGVVISLPDADPAWPWLITLPRLGRKIFLLRRPFVRPRMHQFDGEHYWEVNTRGYMLDAIMKQFDTLSNLRILRSFRVDEFPYHRFFIFERITEDES